MDTKYIFIFLSVLVWSLAQIAIEWIKHHNK